MIRKRSSPKQAVTIPPERLNDYFHSIFTDKEANYKLPMGPAKSDDLTTFSAVTVAEVKLRIGDFQSNKAPGPDGILPCLLKISKDVIALSLAILFNTSLSSGQFPSLFKIANITPILKSTQGPRDCPSNYRPVSLTSILAKHTCFLMIVAHSMWTSLAFGSTVLPDSFSPRLRTTGLSCATLDCIRRLSVLI